MVAFRRGISLSLSISDGKPRGKPLDHLESVPKEPQMRQLDTDVSLGSAGNTFGVPLASKYCPVGSPGDPQILGPALEV